MDIAGHRAYNFADLVDYCPEQQHYNVHSDWEPNPSFPINFQDPSPIFDGFVPHYGSSSSGFVLANQELFRSEIPNNFQDLGFFGSFLTTLGTEVCSSGSDAVQNLIANHFAAAGLSGNCWNSSSGYAAAAQFPYETASSSLSSEELAARPDASDSIPVLPEAADESFNRLSTNAAEQGLSSLESKDFFDGGAGSAVFPGKDNVIATEKKTTVFHRGKKGLPAKNLMAERRRRKKLNDRLYTLRSIVPKISKMDRTSILGDAIEYLKELQRRIESVYNELQNPMLGHSSRQKFMFEEELQASVAIPTEVDVQTIDENAINISMLCEQRPGLLLSTMRALDGLGVDVQEADISFADGFRLKVHAEQLTKEHVQPEEIKAVLLHTAGYFNPGMLPC